MGKANLSILRRTSLSRAGAGGVQCLRSVASEVIRVKGQGYQPEYRLTATKAIDLKEYRSKYEKPNIHAFWNQEPMTSRFDRS